MNGGDTGAGGGCEYASVAAATTRAHSSSSSCAALSRAYCVSRDAVFFLFLLFLAIAYLWRKCPLQVSGGARERQRRPKAGDHLAAAEGQLF